MKASDIKKRRERAGLTQDELADLIGVTKQTVSNWETGRHKPSKFVLQCLQLALAKA